MQLLYLPTSTSPGSGLHPAILHETWANSLALVSCLCPGAFLVAPTCCTAIMAPPATYCCCYRTFASAIFISFGISCHGGPRSFNVIIVIMLFFTITVMFTSVVVSVVFVAMFPTEPWQQCRGSTGPGRGQAQGHQKERHSSSAHPASSC